MTEPATPSARRGAKAPEIVSDRILLRPFQARDLPAFVAYRSDPEVARFQSWDASYGMVDAARFLAEQDEVELGRPGACAELAATSRRDGTLLGDCAVHVRADQPEVAEVGITFAPRHQGTGLAAEALDAVIHHLFDRLRMHRVVAETDDRNDAARRLLERLGFRCEGRLVEAERYKGEWCTIRVYARLRREWEPAPG